MNLSLSTSSNRSQSAVSYGLKPSAQTYVHTGEHLTRTKSKRHSESYEAKGKTHAHLCELLKQLGNYETLRRVRLCSTEFAVISCLKHVPSRPVSNSACNFKACPYCAHKPGEKKIKRYLPLADAFLKLHNVKACKLNLTQKQIPGETCEDTLHRLKSSVQKLLRADKPSGKYFASLFHGGFGAFETTLSYSTDEAGLFHWHCHLIVFRKKFLTDDQLAELKALWADVSPGAENLWLNPIDDTTDGFREQIKYPLKPQAFDDFTAEHLRQYLTATDNARLFFTFGKFRAFCATKDEDRTELEKRLIAGAIAKHAPQERVFVAGECCPVCGDVLQEIRVDRKALSELYRQIESNSDRNSKTPTKSPPGQ